MSPGEYLQGQLERLFELDGMMALSSELLGVEPAELGGTATKDAFARALVRHCEEHDGLEVLAAAIQRSASDEIAATAAPLLPIDDELAPGTRVRSYRVLEVHHQSSLATVYTVASEDGERAHLKVFRRGIASDRYGDARLATRVEALRMLRDPGLVGLVEAGSLPDGRPFLLTEPVAGHSLSALVAREGPLSVSELLPLARSLVGALAALHEQGLVHGFVGPEQIVVERAPGEAATGEQPQAARAKLDGLAVAQLLEGERAYAPGLFRLVGDPATLAPEVARGEPQSPSSEVYALGCVLYYALTGTAVFEASAPLDALFAHLYEEPTPLAQRAPEGHVSAAVEAALMRALEKSPAARHPDVRAFGAALDAAAAAPPPPVQLPEDPASAVERLLERLEGTEQASERAALLREVGASYEQLGEPESALVAYTEALAEEPLEASTQQAISRLAAEPSKLEEVLAGLHESLAQGAVPEASVVPLSVVIAAWCTTRLERPDAALPYLERARELDPGYAPALLALIALHRSQHRWDALLPLLRERAKRTEDAGERRALTLEAAGVALEKLRIPELAEELYEEVLAEDPEVREASGALAEIYGELGEKEKLVALLERELGDLEGEARARALCELALLEDGSDERARARFEEALRSDPRCVAAYAGLAAIHARSGEPAALVAVLERELEVIDGADQRVGRLARMGRIAEDELGDVERAARYYEQVVAERPGHEQANLALARCYRALHRFEELVATYDRHARGSEDVARKAELLMQAARVLMADLGDAERALLVCERVLAVAPRHAEALALAARLHAHQRDVPSALGALEVLAETEQDPAARADLMVRAGELLQRAGKLDAAIARYRLALEAAAGHLPALDALEHAYAARGDLRGRSEVLLRRAERERDARTRAGYLAALGRLREHELGDLALAEEAYRRALELDPDSRDARLGLGGLALAERRLEDAVLLLEPVIDRMDDVPSERALPLLEQLGATYRALGRPDDAERAYLAARTRAPEERRLLEPLAELALEQGQSERAAALLESLLDDSQTASALSRARRLTLSVQLGRARRASGDLHGAARLFALVQELDPDFREALDALAEVQEELDDPAALRTTLDRLLELSLTDGERHALLLRAGELSSRLGEPAEAARYLEEARDLDPDDRNVLAKLMTVYSDARAWRSLCEVLVRLANIVEEPEVSAKYLSTAGGIARRELGEPETAADYYEAALRFDDTLDAAFAALSECLRATGGWDRLASAQRSRIDALARRGASTGELAAAWDELGTLHRDRLLRLEPAIAALEQAEALEPSRGERLEQLVDLYGRLPSRYAHQAIDAHARLLARDGLRVESYRALRRLFTQLARPDEAWTVCQALRSLGLSEPEEEAFYKRHRVLAPITADECLTDELWQQYLLEPEEDPRLTLLLGLIQPAAVQELARPHEALGLAAEPLDCERDPSVVARMLHYAAGVLLLPLPPVYRRPRDPGGVSFVCSDPPAIGLGQGTSRSAPDQALAFIAGRVLTYFRPGYYLRQLVPTGSGLRSWLLAAIRLARPSFPVPEGTDERVARYEGALARTLDAPQHEVLCSLVEQLMAEQPELDLKRWARGVDVAADRAGFVLSNSLDAAVAVIRASPQESSYAGERERLEALYAYAVSPRYHALRKAIGVTIG